MTEYLQIYICALVVILGCVLIFTITLISYRIHELDKKQQEAEQLEENKKLTINRKGDKSE